MATKKEAAPKTAAAKTSGGSGRAKTPVRTDAQLAEGSSRGKMFLFLRKAYNAEAGNYKKLGKKVGSSFLGVERLSASLLPSAVFARAGKDGTEFWILAETDARIVALKTALTSAKGDIVAKKWSPNVAKAMNAFLDIKGARAAGGTNTDILKDISF